MSKLLSGNGLWESSRMMLPQHKERIVADQIKETRKSKPVLHEDEIEEIERKIVEYASSKDLVSVTIYRAYKNENVQGFITEVSQRRKSIRVRSESEDSWILLSEIIGLQRE